MNWFERYGIVGSYFLLISSLWLYACFNWNIINLEAKVIIPIILMSLLPVGYIITVISQWLYYIGCFGERSNLKVYNELKDDKSKKDVLKKLDEIEINSKSSESDIEFKIMFYMRYINSKRKNSNNKTNDNEIERAKYLGTFMTRRFDVISINKALILSTWVPFFSLLIYYLCFSCFSTFNGELIIILLFISIVITAFLYVSYTKLDDQVELLLKNILSEKFDGDVIKLG